MSQYLKNVKNIFEEILNAKTKKRLKEIENFKILKKYKVDLKKYPEIIFNLQKEDVNELLKGDTINSKDFQNKLKTPLEKLFYAMAWKNGDLSKLKHIMDGINDCKFDMERKSAFVFYQFGRYLTKTTGEPIVDQHVLRAFIIYSLLKEEKDGYNLEKILKYSKFETIRKSHVKWIEEYKKWLISDELRNVAKINDYVYYIDRILFALGKAIKSSNIKK